MHDDFKAAKDFFNNMAQNWDSAFTPDPEKIKLITSLCPIPDKAEVIEPAVRAHYFLPCCLPGLQKFWVWTFPKKCLRKRQKNSKTPE